MREMKKRFSKILLTLTMVFSMGLMIIPTNTHAATHVPVTDITGVPTEAISETALTLISTVAPADATNQTIIWSVKDAGTTGATILSGGRLYATSAGTVIVTATITNGLTETTPYTQDFTIMVKPAVEFLTDGGEDTFKVNVHPSNNTHNEYVITQTLGYAEYSSWKIESGAIPAGMALKAYTGYATLQGIPTIAGTYTFTLSATKPSGATRYITKEYKIIVTGETPTPAPAPGTVTPSGPQTGDTSNTLLYLGLIALSGGAFIFGIKKKKALTK